MHYKLLPNLFLISRRGIKCSHMPFFDGTKVYDHLQYPTTKINNEVILLRILFKIWFFGVLNMMKAKVVVFECIFNEIQDRQFALKTGFLGFQVPWLFTVVEFRKNSFWALKYRLVAIISMVDHRNQCHFVRAT